ncbi:BtrH N-terminal domain-containing protein [Paenibacillus sp. FSL R5-0744]|uniref:BtrH N-terminal domain-containing protein n=1 Tax=Paenibacillus sp. FSL R5-0744 TaxID=2921656 RepID=UPI0030DBA688
MIVILNRILPFNNLFFRNCFYNALFPAILYHNKSITPFFLSDIFIYEYDETLGLISSQTLSVHSDEYILKKIGVLMNTQFPNSDVINIIKGELNNGIPVILGIDCYYSPIRNDTYLQKHLAHYILIFGYDAQDDSFLILEHQNRDTLTYSPQKIAASDVLKCYESFLSISEGMDTSALFSVCANNEYRVGEATVLEEFFECFLENIKKHSSRRTTLMSTAITKFKGDILEALKNETSMTQFLASKGDKLLVNLNELIDNIHLEHYRLEHIYSDDKQTLELHSSILSNWMKVRAIFLKYQLTGRFNPKSFNQITPCLEQLLILESNYLNRFEYKVFR